MTGRTDEELREFERLSNLYHSLSEEEKRFIVTQWDVENGQKSWDERLRKKEKKERDRHKKIYITIGVIVLLVMGFFGGESYWRSKGGNEGYMACRGNLENAIENYPDGLRKKVLADFTDAEDEADPLYYESVHGD